MSGPPGAPTPVQTVHSGRGELTARLPLRPLWHVRAFLFHVAYGWYDTHGGLDAAKADALEHWRVLQPLLAAVVVVDDTIGTPEQNRAAAVRAMREHATALQQQADEIERGNQ